MKDTRIVCGAMCTWWDSIDKVGATPPKAGLSIPCCPHCGGVLYEFQDEKDWYDRVDTFEKKNHAGYHAFVAWIRGKCFKGGVDALKAYEEATGEKVNVS